jgi:hypothetical protein
MQQGDDLIHAIRIAATKADRNSRNGWKHGPHLGSSVEMGGEMQQDN